MPHPTHITTTMAPSTSYSCSYSIPSELLNLTATQTIPSTISYSTVQNFIPFLTAEYVKQFFSSDTPCEPGAFMGHCITQEVQEIKQCFQSLMCQLLLNSNGSQNEALASALAALNGVNQRKRPAPPAPPPPPQQPECPVALRPIAACPLPSHFVPQCFPSTWLFQPQVRPASPTLPAPQPEHTTNDTKQWSSPSSVESQGNKTDSGDSGNIDPVGIDASESSSTASSSTQAMMTSPVQPTPFTFPKDLPAGFLFTSTSDIKPNFTYSLPKTSAPMTASLPTHGHSSSCERRARKQISDDYVKLIRQHDLSGKKISDVQIPVPEAIICDSSFRAVSEQQIIQQIVQSKRYEDMDVRECMTQLCKKLAEKRVFGSKLMAQTTVAGPNHSTYSNLPDDGIIYIQHVCRKVLGEKVKNEEEFWDIFRDAMRKLAARCRRVRHAKKTKTIKQEAVQLAAQTQHDFKAELMKREHEWAETLASLPTAGDRPSPAAELARLFPEGNVSSPDKQMTPPGYN